MTQVTALLKEASKLDLPERAELVSSLLEDLNPEPHYVSDGEVLARLEELRSGKVKGLSEEEFWKACGRP
jgi:putative addiction module component (TIGR02574 family)